MENIRCLLADIPNFLLADIIQKITESRPGIEVVGHVDAKNNLSKLVSDRSIDVIVLGADEKIGLQSLNELLDASPQVVAVGVVNDGKRVCVCVEDIGPDEFIALIKVAAQKRQIPLG